MQRSYLIAGSILFGCILVAASLYASGTTAFSFFASSFFADETLATRDDARHVQGAKKPEVTIVEFSDLECPFCAQLHPILERLVRENPDTLAWEYRHLPLSIHPHADLAARLSECVAELGNQELFWSFVTDVYSEQQNLSDKRLLEIAESQGIEEEALTACIASTEMRERVEADMATAARFGGAGTPFIILVYKNGTYKTVAGALPYEQWLPLLTF